MGIRKPQGAAALGGVAYVTYVGSASTTTTTLTVPAHNAGDLILLMDLEEGGATPTTQSGWTSLQTLLVYNYLGSASDIRGRLQWRIDETNSISSITVATRGWCAIVRNASTVANSAKAEGGNTLTANPVIPGLSGLSSGSGALLLGSIADLNASGGPASVSSVSGPYDNFDNFVGYKAEHSVSSFSSGTHITYSAANGRDSAISVEFTA